MKPVIITCCLLVCATVTHAQSVKNIVPNPGFEEYNQCPESYSMVAQVGRHQLCLRDWVAPTKGTTDYFNGCSGNPYFVSVPGNYGGYIPSKEGKAYAGFYVFANGGSVGPDWVYREYIQVQLKNPMKKGRPYCVSFYVRPRIRDVITEQPFFFLSRNVQAYVSKQQVVDTATAYSFGTLPYQPQISATELISDTSGWTRVSGSLIAEGGEEWLTIGNFDDNLHTEPLVLFTPGIINGDGTGNLAYFYIDDVLVYDMNEVLLFPHEEIYKVCDQVLPAPVKAEAGYENYRWSTGATGQVTTVPDTGFYWVEASYEGCAFRDTVQVVAVPPPVVDLGTDIELCEEGKLKTVTLKNIEPLDNYVWSNGFTYDSLTTNRPGKYTLTTRHVCGEISDEIELNGCESTLYIPNVITPESSDENAVFLPRGKNISLQLLEIYDQWGRLVYREEPPAAGWDGKAGGRLVQPGVFIWRIQYLQNDLNKVIEKIGDLTVIR